MNNQIEIYQGIDGQTQIEVKFEQDTVWLSQEQLVELFQRDQSVISRHLRKIFKEGELDIKSKMQKMHIPSSDKPVAFYNLEVIISIGYTDPGRKGSNPTLPDRQESWVCRWQQTDCCSLFSSLFAV